MSSVKKDWRYIKMEKDKKIMVSQEINAPHYRPKIRILKFVHRDMFTIWNKLHASMRHLRTACCATVGNGDKSHPQGNVSHPNI
jgi:hypothetical protein